MYLLLGSTGRLEYLAAIIAIICTALLPGKVSCIPASASSPSVSSTNGSNSSYSWKRTQPGASPVIGDLVASAIGLTAAATHSTTSNLSHSNEMSASNASIDECWRDWALYWNATAAVTKQTATGCSYWSSLDTDRYTQTRLPGSTYVETMTRTTVYTNGPFTMSSATLTATTTVSLQGESATTGYFTETDYESSCRYVPATSTITKPPCSLPTYVPQCQAEWEAFTASGFRTLLASTESPQCSQASMNTRQCSWFQSSYVQEHSDQVNNIPGELGGFMATPLSRGYALISANGSSPRWVWPTQTTLAPSCTLGCARCAVTGGTIQMLYWPTMTTTPPRSEEVVATFLNTTLTYPTVRLTQEQSCAFFGDFANFAASALHSLS